MAYAAGLFTKSNTLVARGGGVHPPPEVLLSWPNPNYVNPEERGWEAPIVMIVMLAITTIIYIARIWARFKVAKNLGLDDILMSIAMLPVFGLTISAILAIRAYGFGKHAWDLDDRAHITSREITMAIELNYVISTTLIKVSILFFYRRITGSLKSAFLYSVWGMIGFCIVASTIFAFLIIFTCSPVEGSFHLFDISWRLRHEVTCLDEGAIIVACAVVGTIQDFIVCLLPVLLVWNLKMSKRQKVALCGIFSVGMLTCICGILRTYYATYVYYYTYDITWYAYYGWVWTALEADLGVMCASAPALKVFFKRYFTASTMSYGYSRSGTNKTPIPLQSRGKGMSSAHSANLSHAEHSGIHDSVPFHGIKVSQGLDIHVEERDDISKKSYDSTRKLTTPPKPEDQKFGEWSQGCRTVCAAYDPSSRNSSMNRGQDRDFELGPSNV